MSTPEDWWKKAGDQWNAWFKSGGGGGESTEFGGLSGADEEFKQMLYDQYNTLKDQEYESYSGDRYADKSPEEIALMQQMQEGHPMYDTAAKDLGFAGDVYKTGAEYGVRDLDRDAEALMGGDTYNEMAALISQDMGRLASQSGMDLTGKQNFGGTGGGDRADLARLQSNLGYHRQGVEALTKWRYGARKDALDRARQLRQDRETSAGRFGQTALSNLGIGTDKVASRFGAYKSDRDYQDRDLKFDYQDWKDKKNWDWKKLQYGSSLFGNMPIEEKGMTQEPASGGK